MTINMIKRIFYGVCIVAVIAMLFFGYQAFDKKNNYYNSEYIETLNKNAYVGGDAYNYIINAGYFAGYAALSGTCAITATVSFGCGAMAGILQKQKNSPTGEFMENSDSIEAKANEGIYSDMEEKSKNSRLSSKM